MIVSGGWLGWYGSYFSKWRAERLAHFGIKVVSRPVAEPITLDDARLHLRVDPYDSPPTHPDDSIISAQLSAAREWCEGDLGLSLAPQTLELGRGGFPFVYGMLGGGGGSHVPWIELPFGPVSSVLSVTYVDGDGTEQTLDPLAYVLDNYSRPARLYPKSGTSWPITSTQMFVDPNIVKVRYLAGYSFLGDSPQDSEPLPWVLMAMILLVLGGLYEHRENSTELKLMELPLGAIALGERYRVRLGMA